MPLRYNNDKRKKPLFSRGLSVCRHSFNSFSKLKCDEKIIEKKRRLFHRQNLIAPAVRYIAGSLIALGVSFLQVDVLFTNILDGFCM